MSLATSIWTWVLVLVFGATPVTEQSNPPPPGHSATSDDGDKPMLPTPPPTSGKGDRIYVGF